MHCLHLLVDLPEPAAADEAIARHAPSLATLLRRGAVEIAETGASARACRAFQLPRQRDWPLAPLCAQADGMAAKSGYWLRLDPAHFEVGMGGLLLHPSGDPALTAAEAEDFADALQEPCAEAGWELLVPTPARWYLYAAEVPELSTTPVDEVAGEYLAPHLPRGAAAAKLLKLLNEAQMLLHAHPLNRRREAEGKLPVNGLWAWGGGVWSRPAANFDLGASNAAEVRALAGAAGIALAPAQAGLASLREAAGAGRVFASLASPPDMPGAAETLAQWERAWFRPLLRALRDGSLRRLRLDLPGRCCELTPARAWRLWR